MKELNMYKEYSINIYGKMLLQSREMEDFFENQERPKLIPKKQKT